MADIAIAIRTVLAADVPLATKIGTRLYPVNRPQDSALPAVRYTVVSDGDGEHLQGGDGVRTARIQFDAFSKSYIESRQVAELIMAALTEAGTSSGIQFGRVRWEGPFDTGGESTQGYIHWARVDLLVEYAVIA
jgi:hypothetical protein